MRVFLAGATGAVGRPLVPKLLAAGHAVTALTRSEARSAEVRAAGAAAAMADVFDTEAVGAAMAEARPEVVVNQLTALPDRLDFRDATLFEATNRLRLEGTAVLLGAARAAGARRFVCQSIAFAYAPAGPPVVDESAPLLSQAPDAFGEAVRAVAGMERAVLEAEDIEGVVLRFGFFYGPGTYYAADGSTAADVRRRRMGIVGSGAGIFSFVHVEDAANATVAALARGEPGVYNVVDDEPAPMREWLPVYAEALGAKRPLRVPAWLARLVAGQGAVAFATTLRGASNAKARSELGWSPAHRSWREGFPASL